MTLAELRKRQGELPHDGDSAHEEHHPDAMSYLRIGAILTLITAVEVALYYIDMNRVLLIGLLFVLSIAKFIMVVAFFMHLKFDNKLFTILFGTGLVATFTLFAVVLAIHSGNFVDI